jgi:hypothetical protein
VRSGRALMSCLEKQELRYGLSYVIGISIQNAVILYSQPFLSKHGLKMQGTMFDRQKFR